MNIQSFKIVTLSLSCTLSEDLLYLKSETVLVKGQYTKSIFYTFIYIHIHEYCLVFSVDEENVCFGKKWGISFSEYVAVKSRVQFNIWFKCKKSGISCKVRNEKQNSEQLHLKVEMKHRLNVEKTKHSFRLSLVKGIRNIVLDRSHKQDINNCFKRRKKEL